MMKRFIFPALLMLLAASQAAGSSGSAQLYNRANDHYTKKEYHQALDLYTELLDRGIENPLLYYNTANGYYRIGRVGYAVLYYEKALRIRPFDRETRKNLRFVRSGLTDRIQPLYENGFTLLRTFFSYMKLRILIFLEIVFFTIFAGFLCLFSLFPVQRARLRRGLTVSGILFFVLLCGVIGSAAYSRIHPSGIITAEEVDVKSSPIQESETVLTLHEGTKIRVVEKRGDWILFSIADGREGWMVNTNAAFID